MTHHTGVHNMKILIVKRIYEGQDTDCGRWIDVSDKDAASIRDIIYDIECDFEPSEGEKRPICYVVEV